MENSDNNKLDYKLNTKIITKPLQFFIIFFWIANVFGSTDATAHMDDKLWQIMTRGYPVKNGYLPVELAIIFLSLYLIIKFVNRYEVNKFYLKHLLILVVIFILILINPNNSATGFEYFLSNDSKFILLISLFYIAINFLDKEVFTLFIKELFRIGFYVLSIKIFYETFMYLIGHGRTLEFFNVKSTIPQSDILYYTGLYVIILLIKYFFTNKKKYLVLSSVFFIIMILSLRRTEVVSTFFV